MRYGSRRRASTGEPAGCAQVTRHVWSLLDGELPLGATLAVVAHLAHCARCRRYARFQRRTRDVIRAALRPQEPSSRARH